MSDKIKEEFEKWWSKEANRRTFGYEEESALVAFKAGRESMQREVMEEWAKPIWPNSSGSYTHIGDRLKELK
jgi:hypothetical protein